MKRLILQDILPARDIDDLTADEIIVLHTIIYSIESTKKLPRSTTVIADSGFDTEKGTDILKSLLKKQWVRTTIKGSRWAHYSALYYPRRRNARIRD